jgi:alpha-beta hydrolase superfamily lysophospholipase
VSLDIGLYVGSLLYRDTIQRELDRFVAAIPERQTATIWIVAHSLGSVIALDSLTNSDG